jgi:hypothetical protein
MLSLVYGGVLSAAQIGKNENEGAYATLADLVSHVSPSDLVLVDASPGSYINQSEIKTPLIYTFHLNAATVSASDIHDSSYMRYLYSRYDNVFLLTTNQGDVPDGFKPVTSRRFKAMTFQWNHSFPHKLVTARNYMLHLYEREIAWTPVDMEVGFGMNGRGVASLRSGWSQPESWGTWSLGSHAIMAVNPANLPRPSGGLELRIQARVLVEPQHPVQNVAVAVNGKHVATYAGKYPDNRLILVIPITGAELASNKAINIAFTLPDAISPAALHLSRDQRVLALGVESAQIVTRRDSAPIPGAGPK